jgi:L-aspartate oxidase
MKSREAGIVTADVLVIGCGVAGASAALEAAKRGLNVLVLSRNSEPRETNSYYAQGGIVTLGPADDPGLLRDDIIRTGDGISNPDAVDVLVRECRPLVERILIDELEVPFDRKSSGELDYAQEAGHSRRRILHVHDSTGRTIEEHFLAALRARPNITLLAGHTAVDLLTVPHHSRNAIEYYHPPRCLGAYVLDNATGAVKSIFAGHTILATGGCGSVFLHTSNPPDAIGAGYAMSHKAGARIVNMEYIQFHPTTLFHRDAANFLISESVRGEGARLKTPDGRTFMEKYSERADLAPRDEVSRAIYAEMINTNSSHVLLDLASYATVDVARRFPTIHETCLRYGIDIARDPIPVVPAAHFCCGGVLVDGWGTTSLAGLSAVGEVSCTGLHGANRLASTSLLEGLVWGTRAGQKVAERIGSVPPVDPASVHEWYYPQNEEAIDPALVQQDWLTIRSTMWNYAGIIRTPKRLERAKADLEYLSHRIERFYREAEMDVSMVGLKQGIQVALMITHAALANPVSLGAHYLNSSG